MTFSRTTGALAALIALLSALLVTMFVTGAGSASAHGTTAAASTAEVGTAEVGTAEVGTAEVGAGWPDAGGSATSVVSDVTDGEVTVDLVSAEPAVAGPGDTVTITVSVANGLERPLTGAEVDLGVNWRPITSRDDLAVWSDGGGDRIAATQRTQQIKQIAPGGSRKMTLELDVDDLALGDDAPWGPREMSLDVVDADGTTRDLLRTFLLFAPDGQEPEPVSVSVLAPVTGPAVDPADLDGYATTLTDLTASGGRLAALADAATPTATTPGITLAADPALVAAAAESSDTTANTWATRMTDGTVPDVATLPAFDPDLAAVAHADLTSAETAAAAGASTALPDTWETPSTWGPELAWPQGAADVATLAAAHDTGVDQVVVTRGLAPGDGALASARTAVSTPSGKVSALVADQDLSDVLAGVDDDTGAATAAETTQRLLADTALVASAQDQVTDADGQTGNLHLLAALPRDWVPDAATLHDVLGQLDSAGWADVVPLTDTVESPASNTARTDLPARRAVDTELAPDDVRDLALTQRSVTSFASVATDPAELAGDTQRALVVPLAVAFRGDPEPRAAAVTTAVDDATELQGGISITNPSQVTLVSDSGELPIIVRNDLPTDASVTVVLRPDDPRLIAETRPTVVVPAEQSARVPVKVRAIGSGNVTIQVEVLAPSGTVVSEPTDFDVQVRAGWETVGTAVIAAAIGLLFIAGIWRTVRRGRAVSRTTGEKVQPVTDKPTSPHDPHDASKDDHA